jgi:tripartite-type tricarboxylate transporter receptor subunit TctC
MRFTLLLVLAFPFASWGQAFPTKPVRVIIPYAPGGGAELQARLVTGKLSEIWGQPVIIENKPGGGTTLAGAFVARSAPDGYTISSAYSSLFTATLLMKEPPFDVEKAFTPVAWLTEVPAILAVPASSPARTVKELVELAKKAPKQLSYGSTGLGGSQHMNAEMVLRAGGVQAVHVPYKGTAQAGAALMAGEIDFSFVDQSIRVLIKTGKVRALAVTSAKRWHALPDVPTMQESIGVTGVSTRNMYLVPSATPMTVVNQINGAIVKALRSPDLEAKFIGLGYNVVASTQEDAARFYQAEYQTYARLVKDLNLPVQ